MTHKRNGGKMIFRNFKNQLGLGSCTGLGADLVGGLHFVSIFATVFLLFASFTSIRAQKQIQPPLESGQRMEIMMDMKNGEMISIVGKVGSVHSRSPDISPVADSPVLLVFFQ
jgi:hypothetical protein